MKYKTIYADPPWQETGGGKIKRGADAHYNLMRTNDICKLPVSNLADENCHLYLWATNNHESKREHSRKPKTMREMIELVSYAPRIELFAREKFDGWDYWGNEIIFESR